MLDFNDAPAELPSNPGVTRESLRTDLVARLESILATLFPAGKKRKGKFLIGDVLGSPGDSLEVVLDGEKAGLWTDRATGDGGDIFDLIAAHLGADAHTDFPRVMQHAADLLGQAPAATSRKTKKKEAPVDDLGPATAKWDYFDAAGQLIAIVYRYDPPGGKKEFRPWDVKRRKMAPPDPRPLYNQPGMKGAAQVVLVEGEKCAQALINAGVTATTAMHGANAPVDKTDWSPLSGKAVLIWPDRDKPGWEYAAQAAQAILSAGAKSCHVLYPPEDAAEGWDAADAITEGFDIATFLSHGPRLQMHDITDDAEPAVSSDESVWGTEDALALAFTRRYHRDWRYVATWGRWLVWDGHRWRNEDTLAATDLIRSVCRHAAVHADTPLLIAVLMRNAKLVDELLKLGADPNKARSDGKGPLFGAVRVGEEKIVQTLLKGGAEVDAPLSMDHNGEAVGGCTALYIAALLGHLPSCKVLASSGASLEAANDLGYRQDSAEIQCGHKCPKRRKP